MLSMWARPSAQVPAAIGSPGRLCCPSLAQRRETPPPQESVCWWRWLGPGGKGPKVKKLGTWGLLTVKAQLRSPPLNRVEPSFTLDGLLQHASAERDAGSLVTSAWL